MIHERKGNLNQFQNGTSLKEVIVGCLLEGYMIRLCDLFSFYL